MNSIRSIATTCLEHRLCLYICWFLQIPAFGSLVLISVIIVAFWEKSYPAWAPLLLSTPLLMPILYITQIIMHCAHRLTPTRMLCMQVYEALFMSVLGAPVVPSGKYWSMGDYTGWLVMFLVYGSFYVLLARSILIWYQSRGEPGISLEEQDEEAKLGDVEKL